MLEFTWIGVNQIGQKTIGKSFANNETELLSLLKQNGIIVLKYKKPLHQLFHKKAKASFNNITDFFRSLLTFLQAGISIINAIEWSNNITKNPCFNEILFKIHQAIHKGDSLSAALNQFSHIFNSFIISLIEIGEKTGTLENSLRQIIHHRELYFDLKQKIKHASIYPCIVIGITILILAIMCCFVIPKFETFFANMNSKLPTFTILIIYLSKKLQYLFLILFLITPISVGYWKLFGYNNTKLKNFLHSLCLQLPFIKHFVKLHNYIISLQTLAVTLRAGIALSSALEMTASVLKQSSYHQALHHMCTLIQEGSSLASCLEKTPIFNDHIIRMLTVAEQSGNLDDMCSYLCDYYRNKLNSWIKQMTSAFEPIITIILSVIIGGITIALYLPLFRLGGVF